MHMRRCADDAGPPPTRSRSAPITSKRSRRKGLLKAFSVSRFQSVGPKSGPEPEGSGEAVFASPRPRAKNIEKGMVSPHTQSSCIDVGTCVGVVGICVGQV